jgi:predicted aminopeptidase
MMTYLLDQGAVMARMRQNKISLAEANQDPQYEKYYSLFKLVPQIKAFTVDTLGFPPTKSYDTFLPNSKKAHWILSAVRSEVLIPKVWSFPIFGAFPYIGYFDLAGLNRDVKETEAKGYDTYVRKSAAFSALGFIAMPVFESMMQFDEAAFVEVLIHELTHEAFYLYGSTPFNEGVAQLMGEQGTSLFLKQHPTLNTFSSQYRDRLERDHRYRSFLLTTWKHLHELLGTNPDVTPPQNWKEKKASIFSELTEQLRREKLSSKSSLEKPWNNARIYSAVIYLEDHCFLEALYFKEDYPVKYGKDALKTFLKWIEDSVVSDEPASSIKKALGETNSCP